MQTLHLPLCFFTKTRLDIHFGYIASLINLLFSSLCTPSLKASYFFGFKALIFCWCVINLGSILRWWQLTLGSMPIMSPCLQAYTSKLSRRKSLSFCLSSGFSSFPTNSVFGKSYGSTGKNSNSSTGVARESSSVILGSKIISIILCL